MYSEITNMRTCVHMYILWTADILFELFIDIMFCFVILQPFLLLIFLTELPLAIDITIHSSIANI